MYKTELNFLTPFRLSRNGIILEITDEFNLMSWAMSQISALDAEDMEMMDKVIVTSLRKLLFENQHPSILLEVCPDFKLPPLKGNVIDGDDKLKMVLPPYDFSDESLWLDVKTWGEQKIAYYEKDVPDLPEGIPVDTFKCIKNRLKGSEKNELEHLFILKTIQYKGENLDVYIRKNLEDESSSSKIFSLLTKAGYYHISIYDFIKHLSDKRGAHIDFDIVPLVKIINGRAKDGRITAVQWFAIHLIYAAKRQIPELSDYWPEMDNLVVTLQ